MVAEMPRNKSRLYVTFEHRMGRPGFHWGLQVTNKAEKDDSLAKMYDITNAVIFYTGVDDIKGTPNPDGRWVYRGARSVLPLQGGRLCGRLLIAKLTEEQNFALHELLGSVHLIQGDPKFTCRVWVLRSLDALRVQLCPEIPNSVDFEPYALDFATKKMAQLIDGSVVIKVVVTTKNIESLIEHTCLQCISDIPTEDARVRA